MDKRLKNHVGEKYGMLTVIGRSDEKGKWICRCECGNTTLSTINNMKKGGKKSCGCLRSHNQGDRFGRLTIVKKVGMSSDNHSLWLCVCDCGNIRIVSSSNLTRKHEVSCGCVRREKYISEAKYRGESKTKLYKIWASMVKRCYNPKATNFKYYGGRGITICNDWLDEKNGYFLFKEWALSNGYEEGLSIERIDCNGSYCPENCTWIPWSEQSKNTRRTRKISYNGKTMCLTDWAKENNMNIGTLYSRLRRGMSFEDALTTPIKGR